MPQLAAGRAFLCSAAGHSAPYLSLAVKAQVIGDFTVTAGIETTTSHFKGYRTADGTLHRTFSGASLGVWPIKVGYAIRVESRDGTVA